MTNRNKINIAEYKTKEFNIKTMCIYSTGRLHIAKVLISVLNIVTPISSDDDSFHFRFKYELYDTKENCVLFQKNKPTHFNGSSNKLCEFHV